MRWIMHPACHKRPSAAISKPDLNVHTQLSPAMIHILASTHSSSSTVRSTWTQFYDTLTGDEYRSETNTDVRQVKQKPKDLKHPRAVFHRMFAFGLWLLMSTAKKKKKKAMCWTKITFTITAFANAFLPKITKLTRLETIKLNAHTAHNLTPLWLVKTKRWHLNNALEETMLSSAWQKKNDSCAEW